MWKYFILLVIPVTVTSEDGFVVATQDQSGFVGDNVTFHCDIKKNTTTGLENISEPVTLQWVFTPVQSTTSVSIYNGTWISLDMKSGESANETKYHSSAWGDITVIGIGPTDAGSYICKLKDSSVSAAAQLYVIDKYPECTKDNLGPKYYEGETVTLICVVGYHGVSVPSVTWHGPDKKHQLNNRSVEVQISAEERKSTVAIKLEHMMDGKYYTCIVEFPGIRLSYSCHTQFLPLSIRYPPYITTLQTYPRSTAVDHKAARGSNLTLYCTAHGNPAPTWQWIFTPDNETTGILLTRCTNVACKIENVQPSNSGKYTCNVMNTVNGSDKFDSRHIQVDVVSKSSDGYVVINTDAPNTTNTPVMHKPSGFSAYAIGAIVSASLAVILIIVFIILALKMRSRERRIHERLSRMHDENLDDQEVELLDENIQPINSDLPRDYADTKQQWEIARRDVRLVELIAKGTFCEVWRGRMRKYPHRNEVVKVAIKRIVSEATEKERKFYLAELEVMKALQAHPNILPLLGFYTANDPWLMMMEFATEGTLYQYLQRRRPGDLHVEITSGGNESVSMKNQNLTAHKLLALAAQVVNGIEHLNKFKMIIYRLRASSVLVCRRGVCKLSGFGFPQDITDRNLYETNSAPVRWMAPESLLDAVYNVKTDVWSYGILLWEITHFGHLPYPDMGPHEVGEKVQTGYRMPQPVHCSEDLYNLMLTCWNENPENRPSFGDILQVLTHLAESATTHIHLENLPDGLKSSDFVDGASMEA